MGATIMYCKIFKRGKGKATGIDYLINPMDANGQVRDPPAKLIRGDINMTKQLIRGLNFSQKYTSGVLSFSESHSEIDENTLDKVMTDFESMVGAGLEKNRLNFLWVKHLDKGRVELHFIIPNLDLDTGKRFATYFDRVDRARFRAWERLNNAIHGFTDPSDLASKRNLQLPIHLPNDKQLATESINFVISTLIRTHHIHSRDEVIQCLKKRGYEINRVSQNYISIQDTAGKKLRLRGAFYEADFTSVESIKVSITDTKKHSESDIQKLEINLETQLKKRRDYIETRYQSIKVIDIDDDAAPVIKPNHRVDEDASLSIFKDGKLQHDSIRKLSDRSSTEYSEREQSALQSIEFTIRELERSVKLFCSKAGSAIERISRSINQLRKSATSTYTY
jgi:hypothetical protein